MFFSYEQSCLWKFPLCFFPLCFGDSYFSIVEFLEIVSFLSSFSACFALWLLVLFLRKCQLLSPILLLKLFPLNLCCYIFIFQGNFVCFLKVGSFLSCIANDLKIFFFLFLAWSFSSVSFLLFSLLFNFYVKWPSHTWLSLSSLLFLKVRY